MLNSSEEFAAKYRVKYGHEPRIYADRAYDGLMLLVDGLMKKDVDESLVNYLHNKTNYKGYATTYSFDEKGDIRGGEWVVERLK
jgi:branched-chain amino acid transport system substrate-binding protein